VGNGAWQATRGHLAPWLPWEPANRPAAASAITLAGWRAFVLARWQVWAKGNIGLFSIALC
jgi:hypothetical protein